MNIKTNKLNIEQTTKQIEHNKKTANKLNKLNKQPNKFKQMNKQTTYQANK